MNKTLIAVRLKPSSVKILKELAAAREETVSEVIRDAVEQLIESVGKSKIEVVRKKGKK